MENLNKEDRQIMKDCLQTRGYNPTDEQLDELVDIYEDCQEWSDEGEMLTGGTYDEIEDFIKHSACVDEVLEKERPDDFEVVVDLSSINDSLLIDSNTQIAYLVRGNMLLSLEVKGEVRVTVTKDGIEETYRRASEMPEWLLAKIAEGIDPYEEGIYIGNNNWFELFIEEDGEYVSSIVVDVENFSDEQIKELMLETLNKYQSEKASTSVTEEDEI